MILKPQDILVLLKLKTFEGHWSYSKLATELFMSPSEVHSALKRALKAKLAVDIRGVISVHIPNFKEFIFHGLSFVFVPEKGPLCRGMPTSYAVQPLSEVMMQSNEPPPVWPDPEGDVRGLSFSPLYKSAPKAAKNDAHLYELLSLVDAIRDGQAREKNIAIDMLDKRLSIYE